MNFHLSAVVLAAGLALPMTAVKAGCAAPSVPVSSGAALTALLEGSTVCVPATNQPVMEAQEEHRAGGELWDYKRGPSHAVDPSKRVGTWSVAADTGRTSSVRYDYGGGKLYSYRVWKNQDGTYSFCSTNPEVVVRIKSGLGPC